MNNIARTMRFGLTMRIWLLAAFSAAILTSAVACTQDPDPTSTPQPEPTATTASATTAPEPTATAVPPTATAVPATATPEPEVEAVDAEPLSIIATSNIVGDWVSIVGGDRVDVLELVPRGADPHAYQPGARDIARVADSDLVFAVGLALEGLWLEELIHNAAADHDSVFEIAEHVNPIPFVDVHGHSEEAHDEDEHAHEEDEHAHAEDEDEHAHEDEDEHAHGDEDEHMEHEEGEHVELTGRLLVGDADSGHVIVLDLMTEEISELDIHLPGPVSALYASPNHRFGYAIYRGDAGAHAVHTIDGGVYLVPHGDHEDLVVVPVSEVGLTVNDELPIHFTNGGEWSAIFHDGSGRAALLNEHEIEEEGSAYEIPYLDAGPQHGAAVPLENDLFAVTVANPDPNDSLPIGVEVRNLDDEVVWDGSREACPGMHGEAHNHHGSAYGCNGGVLFIEPHGDHFDYWLIENGEGMPEAGRVGSLWAHHDAEHFFGYAVSVTASGFEDAGMWMIAPEEREMVQVLSPSDGKNTVTGAYGSHGEVFYALTYDGVLNAIDAADGDVIGEAQLTEPIDPGAGFDGAPSLIIVGDTLFMSDREHKHIVAFDLGHMEVVEEWELDITPTTLAFVGIVSGDDHPEHGHEEDEDTHEDEHAHEDEDEHAHGDEDEHMEEGDAHGHMDEHGHMHGSLDPHFWFDPERVIIAVQEIAEQLSAIEPASEDYFNANRDDYIAKLEELDHWIEDTVAAVDDHDRIMVTSHDAFGYFAARYGFTVAGVIIPGGGTELEPSPQELAELVHQVEDSGATVVFSEVQISDRLASTLAQEAGIRLVGGLHAGTLGGDGSGAENYLDFMRLNVGIIVGALSQ